MVKPEIADRLLSITDLASEVGTTARAIRFYEAKGLLEPQRAGGNRVYTYRDRARLLLILRGKRLGFSLAEVKEYLDLYAVDPTRKADQLVHLLRGTRQRIADLEEQRRDLDLTLEELREIERQTLEALDAAVPEASVRAADAPASNGPAKSAAGAPRARKARGGKASAVAARSTDGIPAAKRGPRSQPPPPPLTTVGSPSSPGPRSPGPSSRSRNR